LLCYRDAFVYGIPDPNSPFPRIFPVILVPVSLPPKSPFPLIADFLRKFPLVRLPLFKHSIAQLVLCPPNRFFSLPQIFYVQDHRSTQFLQVSVYFHQFCPPPAIIPRPASARFGFFPCRKRSLSFFKPRIMRTSSPPSIPSFKRFSPCFNLCMKSAFRRWTRGRNSLSID